MVHQFWHLWWRILGGWRPALADCCADWPSPIPDDLPPADAAAQDISSHTQLQPAAGMMVGDSIHRKIAGRPMDKDLLMMV